MLVYVAPFGAGGLWQAVSLRVDADVLAWLKKDGNGYQTRANRMLRELMMRDLEGRQGKPAIPTVLKKNARR